MRLETYKMATSILLKFLTLKCDTSRTIWRIELNDGSLFCIFHALSFELNLLFDWTCPLNGLSSLKFLSHMTTSFIKENHFNPPMPKGGGGWMPSPSRFFQFFSEMGRAFLQTKFFTCAFILETSVHEKHFQIGPTVLALKLDKGRVLGGGKGSCRDINHPSLSKN